MTNDEPVPGAKEKLPAQRAYARPQLQRFGNIREITQNIAGGTGMNDNQGGGNQKTAP